MPRNLLYFRRGISVSGMGCIGFEAMMEDMTAIVNVFKNQPFGFVNDLFPADFEGHAALTASSNVFTKKSSAPEVNYRPLPFEEDPFGVIHKRAQMQNIVVGQQIVRTQDNEVMYLRHATVEDANGKV